MTRAWWLIAALIAGLAGSADAAPKREVPDYDGRPEAPPTVTDIAAWVPRALLYPVRLVVDYGVRRPVGYVVSHAENSKSFRAVMRRLFREVENANPLIYPVALVDFGFRSSVGARVVFRRGLLLPRSDVTLRLGTGGMDWWRADVGSKTRVGALRVRTSAGANHRPDYVFYGLGSDTPAEARARYAATTRTARASVGGALENLGELAVHGGVTDMDFETSHYDDERTIEEQVAAGQIAMSPAGYATGYRVVRAGAKLTLDSRYEGRRKTSGARFDIQVERVTDLDSSLAWTRVDALVGAGLLLDPVGERKLDVRLGVQTVHGERMSEIPFTELPSLTGPAWLRGMAPGRLADVSAAALIVEYDWPLAAWLDAHAHLGVGNVYGEDLSGFSLASLRGSAGGALTVAGLSDRQIGISYAVGSEPLGGGVDVSSHRLVLEYSSDY